MIKQHVSPIYIIDILYWGKGYICNCFILQEKLITLGACVISIKVVAATNKMNIKILKNTTISEKVSHQREKQTIPPLHPPK